jgi:putative ABC transport system permease protein
MFRWRRRRNRELDEEIQAHLQMAIRDRVERGESPEEARLAALREFGNLAMVQEVTRASWGWTALEQAGRDFHLAARMLRKSPGFAAVVALTLALGVGANSAVFSVARAALAPLPIPQAGRVVFIFAESQENNLRQAPASVPDYREWQASGVFSALGAFLNSGVNVRLGDRTERVDAVAADKGFFDLLAVPPEVGRLFSDADLQPDALDVVILSDRFWRSHFAGDPGAIGKTLMTDGKPHTIIGVVPKAFSFLGTEQLYQPLVLTTPTQLNDHGSRFFGVLGRLRPDLSLAAAQQTIGALEARLGQQFPEDRTVRVVLQPIEEAIVEDSRMLVTILMGAVAFVLLIACANIANLLMARGTARAREMTVRAALGASGWQLTRQLLAESILLALGGGFLAVLPAMLGIHFILSFKLDSLPDASQVSFDWRALTFQFALALATGLVFGLLPARQACKSRVSDALKASSHFHTGRQHQRLRSLLVIAEVALTVVLMAGAGLMVRSFLRLRSARAGYNPGGVLTASVDLGDDRSTPQSITAFFDQVLAKAQSLHGVGSAAAVTALPSSSDWWSTYIHFSDRPDPQNGVVPKVIRSSITPDYFRTMQIPLLRGRAFRESDSADAARAIIIDERTARLYWPNESPVGKRIWIDQKKAGDDFLWREIVGVVGSVSLPPSLESELKGMGQLYLPEAQYPDSTMTFVLRTSGNPMALAEPLRQIVRNVDIDQPLFKVETLEDACAAGRSTQRLAAWVLGAFGLTAMLLSLVGVYGVMAFSVARRSHEFGIRLSLGALPADVLMLVTRQAFLLNAAGIAIGLAGAWVLTGLLSTMLYGVAPTDPATFLAVTGLLATVTMLAAYLPARRAVRVDPARVLREE